MSCAILLILLCFQTLVLTPLLSQLRTGTSPKVEAILLLVSALVLPVVVLTYSCWTTW